MQNDIPFQKFFLKVSEDYGIWSAWQSVLKKNMVSIYGCYQRVMYNERDMLINVQNGKKLLCVEKMKNVSSDQNQFYLGFKAVRKFTNVFCTVGEKI